MAALGWILNLGFAGGGAAAAPTTRNIPAEIGKMLAPGISRTIIWRVAVAKAVSVLLLLACFAGAAWAQVIGGGPISGLPDTIPGTKTFTGTVRLDGSKITAGSGTGVTVNEVGALQRLIYKVTVTYEALSAAGLTADKTIATLPAKMRLVGIVADTTTKYIGGAVTAATLIVGKSAGGNEYIVSHDVFAAAITKGLADADLGTSINRASAIQGGDLPSWTATTIVSVRLTTVTANTNAITQGQTVFYLVTEQMP